jgi:hypothetical protein
MIVLHSAAIFILLLGSSLAGAQVQKFLPAHHRARETVDAIRLIMTMLLTLSGLVLGLLITSAKGRHDERTGNLERFAVDLLELDQRLRQYGPDAAEIRAELRRYTAAAIASTWPHEPRPTGTYPTPEELGNTDSIESTPLGTMLAGIDHMIERLEPNDTYHRQTAERLRARAADNLQQRWRLITAAHGTISWPFLMALVFWLVVIFTIFGLSAPQNALVYIVVTMCALSIASSVYIILDFDEPQSGLLRIASDPLRTALGHMDRPIQPAPVR